MMRFFLIFLSLFILNGCQHHETRWHQTYYLKNPKNTYCIASTPGTFIGTVKKQLKNGAVTDNHIQLSHFTFHQRPHNKKILLTGQVTEAWYENGLVKKDVIHYDLHKISENGVTTGVWHNSRCHGTYVGYALP